MHDFGHLWQQAVLVFFGFFAIMNPIANTAVFVGLTAKKKPLTQKRIAFKSLIIAFVIIVVFSVAGKAVFHLFGISMPALRITGGILVFIIGYQMLHGESSKMQTPDDDDTNSNIAISPLAIPILAGPGTIATAMNFSASGGWGASVITIAAFGILCIISFFMFIFGKQLITYIGESGLTIITRLMGLILAVIGTQMLIVGIAGAIKSFL